MQDDYLNEKIIGRLSENLEGLGGLEELEKPFEYYEKELGVITTALKKAYRIKPRPQDHISNLKNDIRGLINKAEKSAKTEQDYIGLETRKQSYDILIKFEETFKELEPTLEEKIKELRASIKTCPKKDMLKLKKGITSLIDDLEKNVETKQEYAKLELHKRNYSLLINVGKILNNEELDMLLSKKLSKEKMLADEGCAESIKNGLLKGYQYFTDKLKGLK